MTTLPALAIERTDVGSAGRRPRSRRRVRPQRKGRGHAQGLPCRLRQVPHLVRCQGRQRTAGEPETVAAFLAHDADQGSAASTITRRCAAIRFAHKLAEFEPPTNSERVRATLRGIRRAIGAAPARKAPVLADVARAMALSASDGSWGAVAHHKVYSRR